MPSITKSTELISLAISGFTFFNKSIASAFSSSLSTLATYSSTQNSPVGIVRVTVDAFDGCASLVTSCDLTSPICWYTVTLSPFATLTPSGKSTFHVVPLVGESERVAFTVPPSPFNITWTVAITVLFFPLTLTLAFAKFAPEIVVASYNTSLTVGSFTTISSAHTSTAPITLLSSMATANKQAVKVLKSLFLLSFCLMIYLLFFFVTSAE